MGAYPVVREVHVGVEDEGIRESVERVVQLLMGDEVEEGNDEAVRRDEVSGLQMGNDARGEREEADDEDDKIVEIF